MATARHSGFPADRSAKMKKKPANAATIAPTQPSNWPDGWRRSPPGSRSSRRRKRAPVVQPATKIVQRAALLINRRDGSRAGEVKQDEEQVGKGPAAPSKRDAMALKVSVDTSCDSAVASDRSDVANRQTDGSAHLLIASFRLVGIVAKGVGDRLAEIKWLFRFDLFTGGGASLTPKPCKTHPGVPTTASLASAGKDADGGRPVLGVQAERRKRRGDRATYFGEHRLSLSSLP